MTLSAPWRELKLCRHGLAVFQPPVGRQAVPGRSASGAHQTVNDRETTKPDDFKYKVFLSHNKPDNPRVRRRVERLSAAGAVVARLRAVWESLWDCSERGCGGGISPSTLENSHALRLVLQTQPRSASFDNRRLHCYEVQEQQGTVRRSGVRATGKGKREAERTLKLLEKAVCGHFL